jgi:hypothetical protein
VALVVEHLPSNHKVLYLRPQYCKKKGREGGKEGGREEMKRISVSKNVANVYGYVIIKRWSHENF